MTAEIGLFLLIAGLAVALLQASYLLPSSRHRQSVALLMKNGAWLQSLAITLALAALISLRLDNDFSVVNVIAHSNLSMPDLYKITGAWGNHEGSMLLWVWVLTAYGLALAISAFPEPLKSLALAVQSLTCAGFLAFIIFTSNPFARQFPPAPDGEALNPLLQDVALAIHPPLLYLGYVGFSIVFAFAVAALLLRKADREWADAIHPWILFAWASLTLGIGLGSWWAYRELGWGGWWFWDPVENASLLPWLSGTALLHANTVLKKRGLLAQWVVLLAIVTFGLSLLGTFLVRSGVLTSVHGFASDPARGLFILGYMTLLIGGGLFLFARRGADIASPEKALPLSREGMIILNNLFVMTACASVLLGTLYPLLAEALYGQKLTVGPAFFNATFLPLMAFPLAFTAIAPFMGWKNASIGQSLLRMKPAWLALIAAIALVLAWAKTDVMLAAAGFGLAAWLAAATLHWLLGSRKVRGAWGVFLAHCGAAMLVAGITGAGLWKQELEKNLSVGDRLDFAGFEFTYSAETTQRFPNYTGKQGRFDISREGHAVATLEPQYRLYEIRNMPTSEASLHSTLLYDLYAVIGESSPDGRRTAARLYFVPGINVIWLGCVMMALGGAAAFISARAKRHV